MAHVDDLGQSNYVGKKELKDGPVWYTIIGCSKANLAKENEKAKWEVVLNFQETDKPFVLKPTNGQLIHHFTGQGDYERWQGIRIQLHVDPTVSYAGKMVGGVRVKAAMNPQGRPAPQQTSPSNTFEPPPSYSPSPPQEDEFDRAMQDPPQQRIPGQEG